MPAKGYDDYGDDAGGYDDYDDYGDAGDGAYAAGGATESDNYGGAPELGSEEALQPSASAIFEVLGDEFADRVHELAKGWLLGLKKCYTLEARFTEDNSWYDAKINAIDAGKHTFHVTYSAYGNSESVGADRLRPAAKTILKMGSAPPALAAAAKGAAGGGFDGPSPDDAVAAAQTSGIRKGFDVKAVKGRGSQQPGGKAGPKVGGRTGLKPKPKSGGKPLKGGRLSKGGIDDDPMFDDLPPPRPFDALTDDQMMAKGQAPLSLQQLTPQELALTGDVGAAEAKRMPKPPKVAVAEELAPELLGAKPRLNLVVCGHVDSGKSTIMGHMLFDLGNVAQQQMHKFRKESAEMGKGSFAFAWVLDEDATERDRGVTVDVGIKHFETEDRLFTLLDTPGHRDFVPRMISGASQADVGMLVVNTAPGEFEGGFLRDGQTREHATLLRSLGVSHLVVALNKMDEHGWSQERYKQVREQIGAFLKGVGFNCAKVVYVPISGLGGENLNDTLPRPAELQYWYDGPTLLQAINALPVPKLQLLCSKPLRISLSDVFRSQLLGLTVSGKVESGCVRQGDRVLVAPQGELATVKGLRIGDVAQKWARAGDTVELGLLGVEDDMVTKDSVLCRPANPVPCPLEIRAKIQTFELKRPITMGARVTVFAHGVSENALVTKLASVLDAKTGGVEKLKPRSLGSKQMAVVELTLERPMCLELYDASKRLGRFTLRHKSSTLAAGMVTRLQHHVPIKRAK